MIDSGDLLASTILALTIIVIVICYKWRLNAHDLEGYWRATQDGDHIGREYSITVDPNLEYEGGILVIGRNDSDSPVMTFKGSVKFLRRVCMAGQLTSGKIQYHCGTVDLQGRHIDWGGGHRWVREGIYSCSSCIA